jgi:hypothetical protein
MQTATLEVRSGTREYYEEIERQLKTIQHVRVGAVEPLEADAPTLVTIEIHREGEETARRVAQVLCDASHANTGVQGQMSLVTIEGDRVDVGQLSVEQVTNVILGAEAGI